MKVLFIGNSHTYFNDMPELFAVRCEELTGEKPETTMLSYPGRSFEWHWNEQMAYRFALMYGGYDYCVLQQQAHPFPGEDTTFTYGGKLIDLCRENGVKPVIYMTWAEKAHPENIGIMSRTYRTLADQTSSLLAPVGELFDKINREHPEIDLYYTDGEHASVYGDYLISLTLASVICGTRDFSKVSDTAINYHGEDGLINDKSRLLTTIKPEITEILKETVREMII